MSAQFAIGPVNRMAHISKAGYGLGCNGFCIVCNKSLIAKHEDTNELHFFCKHNCAISLRSEISTTKANHPILDFFKIPQRHDQQSFSRFVYENSNLSSGTTSILPPSILPTIVI